MFACLFVGVLCVCLLLHSASRSESIWCHAEYSSSSCMNQNAYTWSERGH